MEKYDILNRAKNALNNNLPECCAEIEQSGDVIFISILNTKFECQVRANLTTASLDITTLAPNRAIYHDSRVLYVTINASPNVMRFAKEHGINILDCAGNYHIRSNDGNGIPVFSIANSGEKPVRDIPKDKMYPIFSDAGIKVIFYLLLDKHNISKPYREIQRATGVALGTVKNIIDGLVFQEFAKAEGRNRLLMNADRLLSVWSANYAIILKPKLLLSRMNFRDNMSSDWQNISLPQGMSWSGESAASISDGYLAPQVFTLYTDIPAPRLMTTKAVVPDADGEIHIYQKFWNGNLNTNIVPAVLIYADLMATNNGRCIEAAQIIKEHELKYLI